MGAPPRSATESCRARPTESTASSSSMLRSHGPDSDGTKTLAEDAVTAVALHVQSTPEDQLLPTDEQDKDKVKKPVKAAVAAAPPTKVLFLDGDLNLGAVAVDSFFVLSSFLLTWLITTTTIRMMNQGAGVCKWFLGLCDYHSKRVCCVYPLFALTYVALWCIDDEAKKRYFLIKQPENFDLYKLLTFEFMYGYFVFWTLPLEISYYFFIPVFVVGTLTLRKFWWVPFIPAYYWVLNEGWNDYRTRHSVLRRHIPTFLAGSMAAVIFVKLDTIAFRGLFFIWVHDNTVPKTPGFPFVSVSLTTVFVCEMMLPSALSSILKWRFLRYWGNISF
ncbi:hypothetical protein PF010_g31494 [Phytophthora fragariae]|uniref:Acyltransferase 3 domain-containing protein n=1 Tax=Phytophthora fragariae TaxID=53985 RepID=A0A6G0JHD8_9STRA|nr:hypothetical protein PF010_g31494 [Phytophthora fragariae]